MPFFQLRPTHPNDVYHRGGFEFNKSTPTEVPDEAVTDEMKEDPFLVEASGDTTTEAEAATTEATEAEATETEPTTPSTEEEGRTRRTT